MHEKGVARCRVVFFCVVCHHGLYAFPPDPKVDLKYNKFWNDLGLYKVPLNPYILRWSIDEYNSKALKIDDGCALNGHFFSLHPFLVWIWKLSLVQIQIMSRAIRLVYLQAIHYQSEDYCVLLSGHIDPSHFGWNMSL